jgi:hypothetical protein
MGYALARFMRSAKAMPPIKITPIARYTHLVQQADQQVCSAKSENCKQNRREDDAEKIPQHCHFDIAGVLGAYASLSRACEEFAPYLGIQKEWT